MHELENPCRIYFVLHLVCSSTNNTALTSARYEDVIIG